MVVAHSALTAFSNGYQQTTNGLWVHKGSFTVLGGPVTLPAAMAAQTSVSMPDWITQTSQRLDQLEQAVLLLVAHTQGAAATGNWYGEMQNTLNAIRATRSDIEDRQKELTE